MSNVHYDVNRRKGRKCEGTVRKEKKTLNASLCSYFVSEEERMGVLIKENHYSHWLPKCQRRSVSISCQNLYMFRSLWILQCRYTAVCDRMAVHSHPLLGGNEKGLGGSTWRWNFKKWKISVLLNPNMTYWLFRNSCRWHTRNLYLFRQFFMPLFLLCPEGLTVITLEEIFSKFI